MGLNRIIIQTFLTITLLFCADILFAQKFKQNRDYWKLKIGTVSDRKESDQKIPKTKNYYFTWFGCESCLLIEAQLDLSKFEKLPLIARPNWRAAAKIHYALELMKVELELVEAFKKNVFDGKIDVFDLNAMTSNLITLGVDKEQLEEALISDELFNKVNRAQVLARRYKIQYVPTAVIKEQYATDAKHTRSVEKFAKVVEYLQTK